MDELVTDAGLMKYRYGDRMTEQELIEVMLEERISKVYGIAAEASYLLSRVYRLNRIIYKLEQIDGN